MIDTVVMSRSFAPPSVLPDISPARGEIGLIPGAHSVTSMLAETQDRRS